MKLEHVSGRLSNALWEKNEAEKSIEFENRFIDSHERNRDYYSGELRHCQETGYADGISNAKNYIERSNTAIADIHRKTAAIRREKLDPANAEIQRSQRLKAALESARAELSGIEGQVAAFLSRAEQNLAAARQNETEAQELVRQNAEARSKCNEASVDDSIHLSDLKKQSNESEKALAALYGEFSRIQNADHEAAQYTAGVLSKLSEQLQLYTTYSLEG